jgi:hypothetical protein
LLGAAEAIKIQKEKKKQSNKRRQEFLQEQKQKRVARLQQIQASRLPEDILNNLSSEPAEESTGTGSQLSTTAETVAATERIASTKLERQKTSTKKVFDSDAEGSDEENEDENYLALDTKNTKFEVVTPRDLSGGAKFRNAAAWTFRQTMQNDPRRVRREDHRQKRAQAVKRAAGGKDGWVRSGT